MEDVLLLENPRRKAKRRRKTNPRRRRRKTRSRRRRTVRAPKRRTTRRRRRRNPIAVATAAPKRSRRRRSGAKRRRNPSRRGGRGAKVLNARRAIAIVKDGASLAIAEFMGDLASRALYQMGPAFVRDQLGKMGISKDDGQKWLQLGLAVVGGPILRKIGFIPRKVLEYWELGNAASAIIALTFSWRTQALSSMGLAGYDDGMADWVTSSGGGAGGGVPAIAAAPPSSETLMDWATVAGSASYTGDPWSM